MTEPVVIEGWTCRANFGDRYARHEGTGYKLDQDGLHVATGPGWFPRALPPAVLAWLCRPLLREAWERGWNQAVAEMQGRSETKANPYEDQ